ncbi:DUF2157 domain-containing protein [Pseudoduganella sp.]|uniref:DUF2157 domain-containing protein n=1 Tax=Pseudoduganella sp. TaxID=1880898 RepID=UPI0035AEA267
MKLRTTIFQLAVHYKLDRYSTTELQTMAGLLGQPSWLPARLPMATAIAGAALLGLGIMFWIAANWDILGRFGRIVLLQGVLAASLLTAWHFPIWRSMAALLALLSIGALFACLGQTYPTGADPWQLFALWAILALPLCLAVRNDVVWMPWLLVAQLAIQLCVEQSSARYAPRIGPHLAGWLAALAVAAAMMPHFRPLTGSGLWSLRLATLTVLGVVTASCIRLSTSNTALWLATPILGVSALATAEMENTDLPTVAMLALGFDVAFSALVASLVLSGRAGLFGSMLIIALVVVAVFAATAQFLMKLHRDGGQP